MFAVVVEDEVVGAADVGATGFGVLRSAHTGSWLGRAHQGRGLGRELREAALHLVFDGLGARFATTSAFDDNEPSLGVTRSLGYRPDGPDRVVRRGAPATVLRFRLEAGDWRARLRRDDVDVLGLEPCLPLLGAV